MADPSAAQSRQLIDVLDDCVAFLKAVEWTGTSIETDASNLMERLREESRRLEALLLADPRQGAPPQRDEQTPIQRAAWCGNSVYHDDYDQGRFDDRCGACRRSLAAIENLLAALPSRAVPPEPPEADKCNYCGGIWADCDCMHPYSPGVLEGGGEPNRVAGSPSVGPRQEFERALGEGRLSGLSAITIRAIRNNLSFEAPRDGDYDLIRAVLMIAREPHLPERERETRPHQDKPEKPTLRDAAEMLWIVIANVSGGDWTLQSKEWQEAAARWRDNYFAALAADRAPRAPQPPDKELEQAIAELEMAKHFLHESGTDPEAWIDGVLDRLRKLAAARQAIPAAPPRMPLPSPPSSVTPPERQA